MECWVNVRRVLNTVAFRFGFHKRGLLKLRNDIRDCEYNDVQVMWEMLRRNEVQKGKKGSFWNCFGWARSSPYLGRSL